MSTMDKSQGPRSQPYLDRKLCEPIKMRAMTEEQKLEHFQEMICSEMKAGKDSGLRDYEVAWKVGKNLIRFEGIDNKVQILDELTNNFYRLGYQVAVVTKMLNSSMLVQEQHGWLGLLIDDPDVPGGYRFDPERGLASLKPIQDCTHEEKLMLYTFYQRGLAAGFTSSYGYDLHSPNIQRVAQNDRA